MLLNLAFPKLWATVSRGAFRTRIRQRVIQHRYISPRDYQDDWFSDCGCGPKQPCPNGPEGRDWQRFLDNG